jgi:hypothetical protein
VIIVGWSLTALLLSLVAVVGLFIGAMYAIAMSDVEGERWLKVAFWFLAPVPVAVGVGALLLGVRGVLPGTGPTA